MSVPACADDLDPRKDPPPECTDKNRLRTVRFFSCVCKAIPVEERVLATIKEDWMRYLNPTNETCSSGGMQQMFTPLLARTM